MSRTEAEYDDVRRLLRAAHGKARRLMGLSADWTAKGQLDIDFAELRRLVRQFGRCQLGLAGPGRTGRA